MTTEQEVSPRELVRKAVEKAIKRAQDHHEPVPIGPYLLGGNEMMWDEEVATLVPEACADLLSIEKNDVLDLHPTAERFKEIETIAYFDLSLLARRHHDNPEHIVYYVAPSDWLQP